MKCSLEYWKMYEGQHFLKYEDVDLYFMTPGLHDLRPIEKTWFQEQKYYASTIRFYLLMIRFNSFS